jgi:hypothetical protein
VSRREPEIPRFYVGDRVRLRKPHPCGGDIWRIYRTGMDIGVRCETCGHPVMIARPRFERRVKAVLERGPEAAGRP